MSEAIQAHNTKAANTWSSAGEHYDDISRSISDAIEHCIQRLAPAGKERVLDLACGTGWTSRAVLGVAPNALVTGADIADGLLGAARARARAANLSIDYELADAERLPYANGAFDVVVSTFGIMFTAKPEVAAAELARVCKKGGRIGLTTWLPDSTVFEMFTVMKAYMPSPPSPPPPSPFAWGKRERVIELLAEHFDLGFEEGISTTRAPSAEAAWEWWLRCYGPIRTLAANLDDERRLAFKKDMIAFHDRYKSELGIAAPRKYLVTIGRRK